MGERYGQLAWNEGREWLVCVCVCVVCVCVSEYMYVCKSVYRGFIQQGGGPGISPQNLEKLYQNCLKRRYNGRGSGNETTCAGGLEGSGGRLLTMTFSA